MKHHNHIADIVYPYMDDETICIQAEIWMIFCDVIGISSSSSDDINMIGKKGVLIPAITLRH